jgi:hypothetical protein
MEHYPRREYFIIFHSFILERALWRSFLGNLGIERVLPLGYIVHHIGKLNRKLEVLLLVYVRLL